MTKKPTDEHVGQQGRGTIVRSGLGLLALLAGCTTAPRTRGYLPPSPVIVDVVEHDHRYSLEPRDEIPPGRAVFRVRNHGEQAHDLSLVPLSEDMPPIDDQLRSSDRRVIPTLVRRPSQPPGGADVFAVDLTPGRYALLCFEKDGRGESHALMGMAVEFRVTSPAEHEGPRG